MLAVIAAGIFDVIGAVLIFTTNNGRVWGPPMLAGNLLVIAGAVLLFREMLRRR